jgi:hypothetical protein
MYRTNQLRTVLTLAMGAMALTAPIPGFAQQYGSPMAQVYPGVYRPVAVLPTAVGPVFPSLARLDGSFRLGLVSEEQVSDSVVRSRYAADGVAVTLTSMDGTGGSVRIIGRVDVVTQTTLDADGNGRIEGALTFTSRSRNGIVAPLLMVQLSGNVTGSGSPLNAEGQLSIPATTRFERPVSGDVSATLSSDANLTGRLLGTVSNRDS